MKALILAPHADDETLGMGGTIAKLVAGKHSVVVAILTGHGEKPHPLWGPEQWDTVRAEARLAMDQLGVSELVFRELPAACLDMEPTWRINAVLDELVQQHTPDEIYVPFAYDLHGDHRAIAYGASVASRPYLAHNKKLKRVLAYETLTETHLAPPYIYPAFQPNVFVDISDTLEQKLSAASAYASQLQQPHQPRSLEALQALARFRGSHIGTTAAEAFILLGEYIR